MESKQMEVKQQLNNSKFASQTEFDDLLKKANFSLQEYIDLYDLVYTIAYPDNFRKISFPISLNVQTIVSRIPCCLHPAIYRFMLISIDDAMTNHPDFVQMEDDTPF
jgi:hypothetical protein